MKILKGLFILGIIGLLIAPSIINHIDYKNCKVKEKYINHRGNVLKTYPKNDFLVDIWNPLNGKIYMGLEVSEQEWQQLEEGDIWR